MKSVIFRFQITGSPCLTTNSITTIWNYGRSFQSYLQPVSKFWWLHAPHPPPDSHVITFWCLTTDPHLGPFAGCCSHIISIYNIFCQKTVFTSAFWQKKFYWLKWVCLVTTIKKKSQNWAQSHNESMEAFGFPVFSDMVDFISSLIETSSPVSPFLFFL